MWWIFTETKSFEVLFSIYHDQLDKVTKVLTQTVSVNISRILSIEFFMFFFEKLVGRQFSSREITPSSQFSSLSR